MSLCSGFELFPKTRNFRRIQLIRSIRDASHNKKVKTYNIRFRLDDYHIQGLDKIIGPVHILLQYFNNPLY